MITVRCVTKPTIAAFTHPQQSYYTYVTAVGLKRLQLCIFNPDSRVILGNSRFTTFDNSNRRYLTSVTSCFQGTTVKFISTFCSAQPDRYKQQDDHVSRHRSFQTSSSAGTHREIVQNDKSKCLEITLGMSTLNIPFIWLRDHCRSKKYYNHKTFQKNVDPDLLKKDLIPSAVEFTANKEGVAITWSDGHVTKYSFEFLVSNFYPGRSNGRTQRLLWDKIAMESEHLPAVQFDDHMTTDSGLRQSLSNLVKYGFTFVNGAPVSVEGIEAVVERITFVARTIFGRMWSFTSDASRGDTAYTTLGLGAHTDNTYLNTPAGIQVFQCLEHKGSGGETLLVDGFNALEALRMSDPDAFKLLSTQVIPHEYKETANAGSPGYHLYSLATVVSVHPSSGEILQIRYNPYDRAPLNTVAPADIESFYEAYNKLSRIIRSPGLELWVKLQPGSVLLIDNWRVLHGRAEFDGRRMMSGCYLPRDEWTSKARLMGVL